MTHPAKVVVEVRNHDLCLVVGHIRQLSVQVVEGPAAERRSWQIVWLLQRLLCRLEGPARSEMHTRGVFSCGRPSSGTLRKVIKHTSPIACKHPLAALCTATDTDGSQTDSTAVPKSEFAGCAASHGWGWPSLQTDRAAPLMADTCGVRDWLGLEVLPQGQVHSACEPPC